jgi:aspartate 1-decarboxylase
MKRKMMRAKIHRARVTQADVEYEGSVTIDQNLMKAVDMIDGEAVALWNVTNGERLETYALTGPPGSGVVCVNGAAAHKMRPGDTIIITAFAWMDEAAARHYKPKVILMDEENRIKGAREEVPGPQRACA